MTARPNALRAPAPPRVHYKPDPWRCDVCGALASWGYGGSLTKTSRRACAVHRDVVERGDTAAGVLFSP